MSIPKSKKSKIRLNSFDKYDTTIYDKIPETNEDIYVISTDGDRLDILAYQFYGDSSMWWYIAQANHINTMNLEPGTSLRIPASTQFAKGG